MLPLCVGVFYIRIYPHLSAFCPHVSAFIRIMQIIRIRICICPHFFRNFASLFASANATSNEQQANKPKTATTMVSTIQWTKHVQLHKWPHRSSTWPELSVLLLPPQSKCLSRSCRGRGSLCRYRINWPLLVLQFLGPLPQQIHNNWPLEENR